MTIDEIPTQWEVYDAPLGQSVAVRLNGFLVAYVADRGEALRPIITRISDRDERDEGFGYMIAA